MLVMSISICSGKAVLVIVVVLVVIVIAEIVIAY
jgi:hypothetical protein